MNCLRSNNLDFKYQNNNVYLSNLFIIGMTTTPKIPQAPKFKILFSNLVKNL